MNIVDIILLGFLLVCGVFTGLKEGFIYQLVGIIALVLGAWLSFRFASTLGAYMASYIQMSSNLLNILSFIVIFLLVFYVLYLLGMLLKRIIKISLGGWIDRLLGVVFALVKVAIVLGLLIMLFDSVNNTFGFISQDKISRSTVYVHIREFTNAVFPYLKSLLNKGHMA